MAGHGRVFHDHPLSVMGGDKVFERPEDGGRCFLGDSIKSNPKKMVDKSIKQSNIQPITQSQKPGKVLDPRYSYVQDMKSPEKLPIHVTKSAVPSTQTKPVHQVTEDEINSYHKNLMTLETSKTEFDPPEKLLFDPLQTNTFMNARDLPASDFGQTDFTSQGLNVDNRVSVPTWSLGLDQGSTDLMQYLGGPECSEFVVTVDGEALGTEVCQVTDDDQCSLAAPSEAFIDGQSQNLTTNTKNTEGSDTIITLEYGRQKWDSDINTYQNNLDLSEEDIDILQSVIDVHITTEEEGPVSAFQPGCVCFGTLEALMDLASKHADPLLQDGLTGIVLKQEYTFFKDGGTQFIEKIGEGSFGSVFLCQHPDSGKNFVVKKILDKSKFRPTEAIVSSMIDDRYLLKCHGLLFENSVPLMIKDFGGESLLKFAQKQKLTDNDIWDLTSQLCKGLKQLAQHDIIHLDIKPENIFIQRDEQGLHLRIGDFGSAKLLTDPVDYSTWTPEYMSPEMAKLVLTERVLRPDVLAMRERAAITTKCDVYPAGLVIMFMYTAHHVFLHELVTKGNPELNSNGRRLNILVQLVGDSELAKKFIPSEVEDPMKAILCDMLESDYNRRLSAEQILLKMDALSSATTTGVSQSVTVATRRKLRTGLKEKVILMGIEDLKTDKQRPKRRARRSTSGKSGKKMTEKENEEAQGVETTSAQYNKIMNEPSQVRVRMVKKLLRSKVVESTTSKRPMDNDPPPPGKRMRVCPVPPMSPSYVGSPVSDHINMSEYSLSFGCIEEDGAMTGEVEEEVPEPSFTNMPDLDALKLS